MLCRSKAFNLVALVEFVVTRMEAYYQSRLMEFANGRIRNQHIMLSRAMTKCEGIPAESITKLDEGHYEVRSATQADVAYSVDAGIGICTCPDGCGGRFCKHIAAVYKYYSVEVPNLPACSAKDRYEVARLAHGPKALPYDFFGESENVQENENMVSLVYSFDIIIFVSKW